MAGLFRSDSGAPFQPGRSSAPTAQNARLRQRPEAGRAPQLRQGVSGGMNQQSLMPPTGSNAPTSAGPLSQVGKMFARGGALSFLNPMTPTGAIVSTAQLPGSEDPSIKWARLGYPSQEAYEQAIARMPSVEEQTRRINNGGKSQMAYFGDNYKEEEAKLFVDADRSRGKHSSSLPASAAVPGTGPENNQVGSDARPATPGLQGDGAPAGPRTNANGLQQYGKTLGGLNEFTKAFTGGYELADIKTAFQSNTLPGAAEYGANRHQLQDTPYELPASDTPTNAGGTYSMDAKGVSSEDSGFQIKPASMPLSLGQNTSDPQEGASDAADVADQVRAVRMQRKGPRDEGSFRGFTKDRNNAIAQQPKAEAPSREQLAQEQRRSAIRSTFLDTNTPIIQASIAANALAGYGKDSNGVAQFNYGGELVQAKEGMQQQAKNAAMMGRDPSQFLNIPATPDTKPDAQADSEISMTAPIKDMSEDQQKQAAQVFAQGFVSDISGKLKNK